MGLGFSLRYSKGGGVGSDQWRIRLSLIPARVSGGVKVGTSDQRVWLYASSQRRHDQDDESNGQQRKRILADSGDKHISTHNAESAENYRNQPKRLTRGIRFPSHISFSLVEAP